MTKPVKTFKEFDPPPAPRTDGQAEPSLTKQSFRDECDINLTIERYGLGQPGAGARPPMFGDFSELPEDYLQAQTLVIHAEDSFAALPAKIRDRFRNDPRQLLAFVSDPNNQAEAVELGLVAKPPPPVPPTKVEIVNPAPSPSEPVKNPAT